MFVNDNVNNEFLHDSYLEILPVWCLQKYALLYPKGYLCATNLFQTSYAMPIVMVSKFEGLP